MRSEAVTLYPALPGADRSDDYELFVNGQPVHVHTARVSAAPLNQGWPGYQRPLAQTELASFAYWDMDGGADIRVVSARAPSRVVLRPLSTGIVPKVSGREISFHTPRAGHLTLEVEGRRRVLHLFASPADPHAGLPSTPGALDGSIYRCGLRQDAAPDPKNHEVIFFPPGIHEAGVIELRSGQTVYISGGAIVHGMIRAQHASDIRVLGRGILDGSGIPRLSLFGKVRDFQPAVDIFGTLHLVECSNVRVEGIVIRDPNMYAITPVGCRDVRIADVKVVGLWRYNSDGIDSCNCEKVVIERCFVRSFDDSIVIKGIGNHSGHGLYELNHRPVRDILVRDCVVWNDWGRALEIGAETAADEITGVRYQNCDIIHATHAALSIQHSDAALVHDVVYDDIRVELHDDEPAPVHQNAVGMMYADPTGGAYCPQLISVTIGHNMWSVDREAGRVRNIRYRNIRIFGTKTPDSILRGFDDQHRVEDIVFENVRVGAAPAADAASARTQIGEHVRGVTFRADASAGEEP